MAVLAAPHRFPPAGRLCLARPQRAVGQASRLAPSPVPDNDQIFPPLRQLESFPWLPIVRQ